MKIHINLSVSGRIIKTLHPLGWHLPNPVYCRYQQIWSKTWFMSLSYSQVHFSTGFTAFVKAYPKCRPHKHSQTCKHTQTNKLFVLLKFCWISRVYVCSSSVFSALFYNLIFHLFCPAAGRDHGLTNNGSKLLLSSILNNNEPLKWLIQTYS